MTNPARARWLNRTVLGVGLASLLSDVGHEMATAALPAFLASLGASSAALGLIEGLSDGLSGFAKLFSGAYSDRLRRRKPLAVVGYVLTAAGMASFALATSVWHVLAGRAVGWLGRGARTPVRKALLKEGTTPETYGRAYGLERAMDSTGAVIGPLLALALAASVGVRGTFALTLVPGAGAAIAIALLVREGEHSPGARGRSLLAGFRDLPARYRRLLLGIGIAGLGDFSNTLLILFATQAFTPRLGAARAAVVAMGFYVGYNVVYTVSCWIAGVLADRHPKARVLAFGYALAVVPAAALLLPGDSYAKFAVVFGFSGLYMGFWETVESAAAATLLPATSSGTGFGVLESVNGLGDFVSSVVVGTLWTRSPALAMAFVAVVSLSGALVVASTSVESP
jgi:predicted MFS family arabinose efflux permease